ncbi:unnamed protein product [Citrullus colocynthis]|uniref:Uncharacterized protein n=1 Tax=Citrullus colocynthis TaxID=252529 RepID=A0ABP0YEG6_9ROSI
MEIPALMGVAKAILENMIFVHQDEANWPFQEPSTLLRRNLMISSLLINFCFFVSMNLRYTKAEDIKKLYKDQAHEIKTYELKLEHLPTKNAVYGVPIQDRLSGILHKLNQTKKDYSEELLQQPVRKSPLWKPCAVRVALILRKYSVYNPKYPFCKVPLPLAFFFFDRFSSSFPVAFLLRSRRFSPLKLILLSTLSRITTYKFVGFLYHSLGLTGSVVLRSFTLYMLLYSRKKFRFCLVIELMGK